MSDKKKKYYLDRPIKDVIKADNGQVAVTFDDDKEPKGEIMHEAEFNAMAFDEPTPNRSEFFQAGTFDCQKEMLSSLELYNPRWLEIPNIIKRLDDKWDELRRQLHSAVYGVKNHIDEVKVKDILDKCINVETGEIDYPQDISNIQKDIIQVLAKYEMSLSDVLKPTFYQDIVTKIDEMNRKVLTKVVQVPLNEWRLDDIIKVIEKYISQLVKEKSMEEEKQEVEETTEAPAEVVESTEIESEEQKAE